MHADELDIDVALVRQLVALQFPEWSRRAVTPVEPRGTDNALFRIGDDLVARLPRRARDASTLAKELVWLPRIAPRLPLAVPMLVAEGAPSAAYPLRWCVYRWIEGSTAAAAPLDDLARAAIDLAGFIRALEVIDAAGGPPPGEHNAGRGAALVTRDAAVRGSLTALAGRIDARAAAVVWEASLAAPRWGGDPVWIHGDLDARNTLVAKSGRLRGVLDWGCLGVGDPASDVMVAWKMLSRETRPVFRDALGVDDATWARARGWALSQALTALAYYTLETNALLVRQAARWLDAVLADAR